MGFFSKIKEGLKKTKDAFFTKLNAVFHGGDIDEEFYEELEFSLISADIGVDTSRKILDKLQSRVRQKHVVKQIEAKELLKEILTEILDEGKREEFAYPLIITIVGVNGVGKTTTIGKLAHYFKSQNKSVLLVAGDTFRAAASDQLSVWDNRSDVRIVRHDEGADPSAVVFDGLDSAKAKKTDVVIVDTAGRLHTKVNLLEELGKIFRTQDKQYPEAKKMSFIVLDSTIGQNSISQIQAFRDKTKVDGIILTKLDGTSKGGVVFSIVSDTRLPIYFVGLGEKMEDLEIFDSKEFVDAIL